MAQEHTQAQCASCAHEHTHEHGAGEGGRPLLRIGVSAALFAAGLLTEGTLSIVLFAAAYLLVGFDILKEAVENLLHARPFDETFLMALASIGAIGIGEITSIPTAPAIQAAYYYRDGDFRTSLPLSDTPYRREGTASKHRRMDNERR